MRKLIADFIYFYKRGYGIRRAWQLARLAL